MDGVQLPGGLEREHGAMPQPGTVLAVTPEERSIIEALVADGDPAAVRAARIILLLAEGVPGKVAAVRLGTSQQTVCAWRKRFLARRLTAFGRRATAPVAPAALPEDVPLQPATLEHIAALMGVHRSTVHRILRGGGDGSPLAERVITAARDLGYRPQPKDPERRATLHRFRSNALRRQILLLLPENGMRDPYFARMAVSTIAALSNTRFDALVRQSNSLTDRQLPPGAERGEIAAVISHDCLVWQDMHRAQLDRLPPECRPALIGLLRPHPGIWCATIDFAAAAGTLIDHMVALGHRRFIAIEQRAICTAGFRAALARHGLDPDQALVVEHMVPDRVPEDVRLARTLDLLLTRQPAATALLAANDPMALDACRRLAAIGRPVPQAMSVAGFDGTHGEGFLASIAIPLEEVGQAAAALAMAPGTGPRTQLIPWSLRTGPSLGRCRPHQRPG